MAPPLADWFNLCPDVIYVTGEFLLPLNLRENFPLRCPVIPEGGKFSRCKFRLRQSHSPQSCPSSKIQRRLPAIGHRKFPDGFAQAFRVIRFRSLQRHAIRLTGRSTLAHARVMCGV
ncbi:hypothetical protein C5905_05605 [Escherichia coli O83:H28]|nr:hypothetical protein [Escherichia coli O83:H28]